MFSWKRLLLTTTVDGKVSIIAIAKTFASGKTEKQVYESLSELDLPSGKVKLFSFILTRFFKIQYH